MVDGAIVGPASLLMKKPLGVLELASLGTGFDGEVVLEKGRIFVSGNDGLGSTVGKTRISSSEASMLILGGSTIADDFILDNATGRSYTGALMGYRESSQGIVPAVITGTVDLGGVGSFIGMLEDDHPVSKIPSQLALAGPIVGGSLIKLGAGDLLITGNANTYTGQTVVMDRGLILKDQGSLATTSGIRIDRGVVSRFVIDNTGSDDMADRVSDSIPVEINGGTLVFRGGSSSSSETLGHTTLNRGHAVLESELGTLNLTGLTREPGATATFGVKPNADRKITLANPPTLINGIIGGWATVERSLFQANFVTYDPINGFQNLPTQGRPSQLNGALATDNVFVTVNPAPLTSNTTINSLAAHNKNPSNHPLNINLGDNLLTIESGGVLSWIEQGSARQFNIINGDLTAGIITKELTFISTNWHIDANLVDNSEGSVGVTVGGTGIVFLRGNNTYSGKTTVNSQLNIQSASAVPPNNEVVLNGGTYSVEYASAVPVDLSALTIRDNAWIESPTTPIDADSIQVESGRINAKLSGNGSVAKTTHGYLTLAGVNDQFNGDITIYQGVLETKNSLALGTGTTTVLPGGRLLTSTSSDPSLIGTTVVMAGGEWLGGDEVFANVHVVADSTVSHNIDLRGSVMIDNGVQLSYDVFDRPLGGDFSSSSIGLIDGDLIVGQDAKIFVEEGLDLDFKGTIQSASPVSTVDFLGPVDFGITGLTVNEGHRLLVTANGSPITIDIARHASTVTGGGTLENDLVVFTDATVQPGNGVGRLTLNQNLQLGATTQVEFEIAGSNPVSGYDQLNVVGDVSIFFSTLNVSLLDGFLPNYFDEFDIITAGSRSGRFYFIDGALVNADMTLVPIYDHGGSPGLTLVAALPGDANLDGTVNGLDLLTWQANLFTGYEWDQGDFNLDGRVDGQDLLIWQSHLFDSVADLTNDAFPFASNTPAVPVPGTLSLIVLLGGMGLATRGTFSHR